MAKIKVLIVDDSAVMRQILREVLSVDPDIEVVGVAPDPLIAHEKILRLQPDVLTLDIEMPRMDGLTFLDKLMRSRPMPVVMISSMTDKGCDATLRALELGAVDFIAKPKLDVSSGTIAMADEIVGKVKAASRARIRSRGRLAAPPLLEIYSPPLQDATHKLIAIGASTGGTEALRELLPQLPADSPAIAIVQHMPERFTTSFAKNLDQRGKIRVSEAKDGDRLLSGHALLAPGNFQMEVIRSGAEYRVRVFSGERVNHHRPSVDVMFRSCATAAGSNALGVILTGMGDDGAAGMAQMRRAGAYTIAQDEATSVVFGMPKEAINAGGVCEVAPLERISASILRALRTDWTRRPAKTA